ncbi:MAG: hypothetical protein M0P73_11135 [Syntrophobacterales bacterium]|jgi:hypothetical protein|nr:hypothetical protein [Syntrophobacterales bacterium]
MTKEESSPEADIVPVAPPPSAASWASSTRPLAKPAQAEYRRDLPHLQVEDKPLFVTFVTYNRWVRSESVRGVVLRHGLHDHEIKLQMRRTAGRGCPDLDCPGQGVYLNCGQD